MLFVQSTLLQISRASEELRVAVAADRYGRVHADEEEVASRRSQWTQRSRSKTPRPRKG
jgi:hypothetical protein